MKFKTKPQFERTQRNIDLLIIDKSKSRQTHTKRIPLLKINKENCEQYIDTFNYCSNLGLSISLMKKYGIGIRELEFISLFHKITLQTKIHSQNMLFNKIRKETPQYIKTHQDNRLDHPINETLNELLNCNLIIKETNKFSPFILNPEIFTADITTQIINSINEYLTSEKLEMPKALQKILNKIQNSFKTDSEN